MFKTRQKNETGNTWNLSERFRSRKKEETIWRLSESDCLMRCTRPTAGVFPEPQRETRSTLGAGPTSRNRMSASVCLPSETARDQQSGGVGVVIKTCLSLVSRHVLSGLTTDSRREAAGGWGSSRFLWSQYGQMSDAGWYWINLEWDLKTIFKQTKTGMSSKGLVRAQPLVNVY